MPTTMETYSPEEIANRLDRHINSIRRNLREGDLNGEKFQNRWVVTEEDLKEWLPEALYQNHFSNDEA